MLETRKLAHTGWLNNLKPCTTVRSSHLTQAALQNAKRLASTVLYCSMCVADTALRSVLCTGRLYSLLACIQARSPRAKAKICHNTQNSKAQRLFAVDSGTEIFYDHCGPRQLRTSTTPPRASHTDTMVTTPSRQGHTPLAQKRSQTVRICDTQRCRGATPLPARARRQESWEVPLQ